jgi:hypothetical protein
MALQKQDGGIRPILCGEIWRLRYLRLPMITFSKLQVFGASRENTISIL